MFGNTFGQQNNPLLDYQKLQQMQQYNQINTYNLVNQDKYAEIQKSINNLSTDEKNALLNDNTFMMYNQAYEQGLLAFIASQYRNQYNSSPDGQKALSELENALNSSLKDARQIIETEKEQFKQVSDLIKSNPEILEMLKNKNNAAT